MFPSHIYPSQNSQCPLPLPGCVVSLYPHIPAVFALFESPGMFKVMHCARLAALVDPMPPTKGDYFHQAAASPT